MEIDLAQLDSSATGSDLLRAPICIIGGGIAGLTLAHKLIALGHEVLLLEAGAHASETFTPIQQTGHPHPGVSEPRPRALGGTSLTWGGQLLPFPEDIGTWPISTAELASFTAEAEHLLAVDSLPYDAAAFFAKLQHPVPSLLNQLPQLDASLSKFTPFSHRNLAHTLGEKLRAHSKARIILHAQVTELLLASTRDQIEAVFVRTPAGQTHRIQADRIILAAGTIETVRLLLASRSVAPEGIGNQNDQVGRNFHDHLTVTRRHPTRARSHTTSQRPPSLDLPRHAAQSQALRFTRTPAPAQPYTHPRAPYYRRTRELRHRRTAHSPPRATAEQPRFNPPRNNAPTPTRARRRRTPHALRAHTTPPLRFSTSRRSTPTQRCAEHTFNLAHHPVA